MNRVLLAILILCSSALAQDAAPVSLQAKLLGHWVADKDTKVHTYYSAKHRIVERDIANSDAELALQDYQVWDEWPELRTIILSVDEGTRIVMLAITFSVDGTSAVWREKTPAGWTKSHRIQRFDNKTHPGKLPEKLKILDIESGMGAE